MSPVTRRIVYVASYELVAILLTTVGFSVLGFGAEQSGVVAIAASTTAVVWNYVWTTLFEGWEKRQKSQTRTLRRRIAHTLGFECGLVILLLPVIAGLLGVSLLEALALETGLLGFFLVYTFVRVALRHGGAPAAGPSRVTHAATRHGSTPRPGSRRRGSPAHGRCPARGRVRRIAGERVAN